MQEAADELLTLDIQEDFAEKLATGRPAQALTELIWNGLDAEARHVKISSQPGKLGLKSITLSDDGHGMTWSEARQFFTNLGGSWKKEQRTSKRGRRHLHGKEGRGRLRSLAIARVAEWEVVGKTTAGDLEEFTITIIRDDIRNAHISPPRPSEQTRAGTTVRLSELDRNWELDTPSVVQELAESFALYMTEYPDVSISVDGRLLKPADAIARKDTYRLPNIESPIGTFTAEVDVIEWKRTTERMLYLCDEAGLPLHRILPMIHAPGFEFSAYLKTKYNSLLNQQGRLELAELDPALNAAVENSKEQLRTHFKTRQAEDTRSLVERWKQEEVYPYQGEPDTPVKRVERQVFDILAMNVSTSLRDFETQDARNKRFQLRMLRQAIEKSPEEVQLIMSEVLGLTRQKQEELAKLIKKTSLSAVISAAKLVADRLSFLKGLEAMLFETDLKRNLKERSQLHKILAENTWIFGEQFNLTVSDKSLTEVLQKHQQQVGTREKTKRSVKRLDGRKGIVDLFLTRRVPGARAEELDYLVVELKAPSVTVGQKETGQIKSYAYAIQNDERFRNIKVRWEFWVVSTDMDDFAKTETTSPDRPFGMLDRKKDCEIWVKTWSEILNDCRARLELFEKELNFDADRDESLQFLRDTYAKFLQPELEHADEPRLVGQA
jgi:hypothetical protein